MCFKNIHAGLCLNTGAIHPSQLHQVEEFKCLGMLFTNEERMEREIDTLVSVTSAVLNTLCQSIVIENELSCRAKLSVHQSIYSYPHLWSPVLGSDQKNQTADMVS